jgi:hypothetical protein
VVDIGSYSPACFRISGDGSKVFGLVENHLQAWSTQTGEALGKVEVDHSPFHPLCMGDSRIWIHSWGGPIQGWDFGISGSSPVPLSNISSERPHLHFSCGTGLFGNGPSRIEDGTTGKEVFQLSGRYAKPVAAQWDGQYLVAGYESGEVLILDFKHPCPE